MRWMGVVAVRVALGLSMLMPMSAVIMALELTGEPQQGALLIGHVAADDVVSVDGSRVLVSPEGVFLVGIGRDDRAPVVVSVRHPDGSREQRSIVPEARKYAIQRIDGLPPGKVSPRSTKDLARIRSDAIAVRAARNTNDARTDFMAGFEWPLLGPISGVYGSQRILNGKPRRPHFGIDIAAPVGTPVKAPAGGIVTLANPDLFFSGGTIIVDHGQGLSSSFLHLSKVSVSPGQRIEQGDIIGEVGATGRVTGPHLDWRMNLGAKRLDPGLLMGPMPATAQ